jgi:hypothetical protein
MLEKLTESYPIPGACPVVARVAIGVTGGIVGFVTGHLLDDHLIEEVAVLGVARALCTIWLMITA